MRNWKDNVYFVLAGPKEPGNIGASARAIKNMDFRNLCLVNPPPLSNGEAQWFAHNANDVLESAEIYGSVSDAVGDKHFIAGTSRRKGRKRGAFLPVEEGVKRLYDVAHAGKVAVLFGREDRGLYNNEIEECGFLMTIPVSRKHPSLNLAQAVMIVAYELSKAGIRGKKAAAGIANDNLLTAAPHKVAILSPAPRHPHTS
ncbi:MAG: RNA methyltransferase [Nitrospirae bacterium]|nr:RNA methyltransferase [Nitrospirota bacterium]